MRTKKILPGTALITQINDSVKNIDKSDVKAYQKAITDTIHAYCSIEEEHLHMLQELAEMADRRSAKLENYLTTHIANNACIDPVTCNNGTGLPSDICFVCHCRHFLADLNLL